ncbi:MAG: DUF721 domain-containing protein [Bdellovibrionales bacterium]
MSGRNKDQKLQPVSNVLQTIFARGESPLSDQFLRWRLWSCWADLVGPNIGAYSTPVGFQKGVLVVWVKTAAHMQELNYGRDLIKHKINQFVGFKWVTNVRLTLDRKDVPTLEESDPGLRQFLAKQSPNEDGEPQPGR